MSRSYSLTNNPKQLLSKHCSLFEKHKDTELKVQRMTSGPKSISFIPNESARELEEYEACFSRQMFKDTLYFRQ